MKTNVYIDAANIILSGKNIGFAISMPRLVQYLKDKYRATLILYFTGNFKSMQAEFDSLRAQGVELVFKEVYNEDVKVKANCDVEISHRITSDILQKKVEKIVVVSGDGDFASLYDFARAQQVEVKVIACEPVSCSRVIKRRAFAQVSYLSDVSDRIRMKNPQ